MAYYRLKKGYDIRIAGEAEKLLERAPFPEAVGLYADDFYGMTPKPLVEGGERVKVGTPLWRDRRRESLVVTSPASGTVAEVRRGERRALEAVIIRKEFERERKSYRYRYGCKFENLTNKQQEVICEYVFKVELENYRKTHQ